uniref:Putative secreted protein n=1 Tax=Ixodes scapularis TaxID=6945 RepID=A0A4D5REH7_IXOSC
MSRSVLAQSWFFALTSCVHYTSCDEDQGTGTDGVPVMDARRYVDVQRKKVFIDVVCALECSVRGRHRRNCHEVASLSSVGQRHRWIALSVCRALCCACCTGLYRKLSGTSRH